MLSKFIGKIGRKNTKKWYRICSIFLLILFITSAVLYVNRSWEWSVWVTLFTIIAWPVITFIYAFTLWSWHIEDLMNEYKENNNVLSGGLAVFALFTVPFIVTLVFSQLEDYEWIKEFFKGISTLIITAMPAFIGLLGVQYTVAIQERNRKEDIRLGAKPFFAICCSRDVLIIDEENEHSLHEMKILIQLENISKNIGIPLKVVSLDDEDCETSFKYVALAYNNKFSEVVTISSKEPYRSKARIAIYYNDVYNNQYRMEVEFILHNDAALSQTCIISDEVVKD